MIDDIGFSISFFKDEYKEKHRCKRTTPPYIIGDAYCPDGTNAMMIIEIHGNSLEKIYGYAVPLDPRIILEVRRNYDNKYLDEILERIHIRFNDYGEMDYLRRFDYEQYNQKIESVMLHNKQLFPNEKWFLPTIEQIKTFSSLRNQYKVLCEKYYSDIIKYNGGINRYIPSYIMSRTLNDNGTQILMYSLSQEAVIEKRLYDKRSLSRDYNLHASSRILPVFYFEI